MPDSVEEIKRRYAEEVKTYRRDALKINFEAVKGFDVFMFYLKEIFPDTTSPIRVLDIGAGTGMLTEVLLKEYPNAHVTLLDNSTEMLEQARSYFEVAGDGSIQQLSFCHKDFVSDDLPSEEYDLVMSSFTMHHIRSHEDLVKVLSKIYGVLAPEVGTFLCIDYFLEYNIGDRRKQVEAFIAKLIENGYSEGEAISWANIIESEDTPATWTEILQALSVAGQSKPSYGRGWPLISFMMLTANMTGMYGLTRLSLDKLLHNRHLNWLIMSWRKPDIMGTKDYFYNKKAVAEISPYPVRDIINNNGSKTQK